MREPLLGVVILLCSTTLSTSYSAKGQTPRAEPVQRSPWMVLVNASSGSIVYRLWYDRWPNHGTEDQQIAPRGLMVWRMRYPGACGFLGEVQPVGAGHVYQFEDGDSGQPGKSVSLESLFPRSGQHGSQDAGTRPTGHRRIGQQAENQPDFGKTPVLDGQLEMRVLRSSKLARLQRELADRRAEIQQQKARIEELVTQSDRLRRQLAVASAQAREAAVLRENLKRLVKQAGVRQFFRVIHLDPGSLDLKASRGDAVLVLTWPPMVDAYLVNLNGETPWAREYLGKTPLEARLPPGRYEVSLVPPKELVGNWAAPRGHVHQLGFDDRGPTALTFVIDKQAGRYGLVRGLFLPNHGTPVEQLSTVTQGAANLFTVPDIERFEISIGRVLVRAGIVLKPQEVQQLHEAISKTGFLRFALPRGDAAIDFQLDPSGPSVRHKLVPLRMSQSVSEKPPPIER